jgi:hypothetical protein
MADDASDDWLDVAKTRAQGIRVALAGIGVFVACVLVTIFGQLRQFEADRKAEAITACFVGESTSGSVQPSEVRSAACPAAADWGILQAAYEEYPVQQIDAELNPWNQFAMESTIVGSFVEGTDPKKFAGSTDPTAELVWMLAEASSKTPLKPGTTSEISHFYLHLKDFVSNARSVEGALDAKTPFEAIDRDRLIALANAYAFNLDSGDVQGEYAAQDLANSTFTSQLDRLRPSVLNSHGRPIMEERFVQTLKDGALLSPFLTLRQQLVGIDLGKFQQIDDAEMKRLLGYLMATRFASLNAQRDEDARLSDRIDAVLDGNMTSAISLPFLNLSIDLSAFANLSGFLNLAFLGWMFWQARQMGDASNRYMTFTDADRSRMEAALQGLPGTGGWNLLSRTGFALLVAMPALLGTLLLFAPLWFLRFANLHWYKLLYLILPTVVFILSLTLVSFIQKSSRQALDVPRKPQGGVAGMIP